MSSSTGDSRTDVRTAWTFDHHQITYFGEILVEAGYLSTPREVIDFMYKAWKWQPERDLWVGAGEPLKHDGHRWEAFVAKLEAL